jgi:hypothetical protein
MLISELPQAYRELANKRRDKDKRGQTTDDLGWAFKWDKKGEREIDFWLACDRATNQSELPPLLTNV